MMNQNFKFRINYNLMYSLVIILW